VDMKSKKKPETRYELRLSDMDEHVYKMIKRLATKHKRFPHKQAQVMIEKAIDAYGEAGL